MNEAWSIEKLDGEAKSYIEKNGHKDLASLISDAQKTRALLGADKASVLRVPKEGRAENPSAWRDVDAALGVPEDGDYGEFKPSTGELQATDDQIKAFDAAMAKAGAPKAARNAALDAFHEINAAVRAEYEAAQSEELAAAAKDLQRAWGVAYPEKERAAATALNDLDGEKEFGELLGRYGLDKHPIVTRVKAAIAGLRAEAGAPTGGDAPAAGATLTPDEAKAKRDALYGDDAFMKRYKNGEEGALKQMLALNNAIAGGS